MICFRHNVFRILGHGYYGENNKSGLLSLFFAVVLGTLARPSCSVAARGSDRANRPVRDGRGHIDCKRRGILHSSRIYAGFDWYG